LKNWFTIFVKFGILDLGIVWRRKFNLDLLGFLESEGLKNWFGTFVKFGILDLGIVWK
jgi:hypothetical protein